jgi:hypothetical protein
MHADPAATMQRLEKWAIGRRYYRIEKQPCVVTGDSCFCVLRGEGREVTVLEDEFGYSTDWTPTVVDVIALALEKWERGEFTDDRQRGHNENAC